MGCVFGGTLSWIWFFTPEQYGPVLNGLWCGFLISTDRLGRREISNRTRVRIQTTGPRPP